MEKHLKIDWEIINKELTDINWLQELDTIYMTQIVNTPTSSKNAFYLWKSIYQKENLQKKGSSYSYEKT